MTREQAANWFAKQMIVKLNENQHKGDWRGMNPFRLLNLLEDEVTELADAIENKKANEVIREAADVGNFAMMIADIANLRIEQHEPEPVNILRHSKLLGEIHDSFTRKNHDYGDSFHESFRRFGLIASVVRMSDKLGRIETLSKSVAKVEDESIRDTLLDLANYALMTVMELDKEGEPK